MQRWIYGLLNYLKYQIVNSHKKSANIELDSSLFKPLIRLGLI